MNGTDVGTVQSIDEHDEIVYVLFPVPGPPGRTDVIDVDPAKTAFLYEQMEMSTTEIGDVLGISHDAVANRLRQHGVSMRSRGESARLRFARRPKVTT